MSKILSWVESFDWLRIISCCSSGVEEMRKVGVEGEQCEGGIWIFDKQGEHKLVKI